LARDSLRVGAAVGGSELFRNAHLTIRCDYAQRILIIERSSVPFQRVEEIEAVTQALGRVFPVEKRTGFGVLSDFRAGPVRVHPALEPAFTRYREESERGFLRRVVVVATPVGKIRGDRLSDTAGKSVKMVTSLEEALAYLKGGADPG
jgi:hypothetical protein